MEIMHVYCSLNGIVNAGRPSSSSGLSSSGPTGSAANHDSSGREDSRGS